MARQYARLSVRGVGGGHMSTKRPSSPTARVLWRSKMNCNCGNLHRGTALTATGVLTVTNPSNISTFDDFDLVICLNPNNVVTGAPVPYTVTINGTAVPILDMWGYPIRTDRLCPRKRYHGKYIVGTTAGTHVTLVNVCCTIADALANATPTVATTDGE